MGAVWFLGWVPKSPGAMVGTCISLFLLALVERWIAACRGLMESHWRKQCVSSLFCVEGSSPMIRATIIASDKLNTLPNQSFPVGFLKRFTPPFIPAYDIARGLMFATQTSLNYLFMLTVMYVASLSSLRCADVLGLVRTYQLGFILSLVVGLGVGETLFGRFGSIAHAH